MWIRLFYSTFGYLLLPFAFLKLIWRSRYDHNYLCRWSERLGYVHISHEKPILWLHAVSVGETIAAAPLVEELLKRYPNYRILVTNGTVTGSARTKALFGERVEHCYFPYDLFSSMRRFVSRVRPKLAIIMETEIWPNCYDILAAHKIPILIANARLSPKSFQAYKKFSWLFNSLWDDITMIAAQTKLDADHFIALGVPSNHVCVAGNLKFNPKPLNFDQSKLLLWRAALKGRAVFIAASTHEGEEKVILDSYQKLQKDMPNLLLLLVPRHPERVAKIVKMCQHDYHLPMILRSQLQENNLSAIKDAKVLMVDTLGELMFFYSLANVAFVGGSLIEKGGHNILEPATAHVPIIVGPSMFNFAYIYELFTAANALITIHNSGELADAVRKILTDSNLQEAMVRQATHCLDDQKNALSNHLGIIEKLLH